MNITNEHTKVKIEIFAQYMSEMAEEVKSDFYVTESDADEIASILLDFFVESYYQPSLKEAAFNCITGFDPNKELYDTIAELFLDESVGGFISGAANFIGNTIAKRKASSATSAYHLANAKSTKASNKLATTQSNGLIKTFRSGKANKLNSKTNTALNKAHDAINAHQDRLNRTNAMKQKIDNKITSVKNRIKNSPKSAASAIGSFAARFA